MPETASSQKTGPTAPRSRRPAAWIVAPFRRASRWFSHAPRAIQLGMVVVLAGGLAAGTYYGKSYARARATEREVSAAWHAFDEAARTADVLAMNAALDRVLAASPGDPSAAARRAALANGWADADDVELAIVLVHHHVRQDRLAEAAREAQKVLARYPRHWRALCVLAHHAIQVNRNADEARRLFDSLPDPEDPSVELDAGGLLHALRLCERLGRDAAPLRRAIVHRLLPLLRGAVAESAPPGAKAQLIECYLEPLADRANLSELAGYWGVVSRLADAAFTGAAEVGDIETLARLGALGDKLLAALGLFREHQLVPDDQFVAFAREVNNRTCRVWQAIREKQPGRPEPYAGLALLAMRSGQYREAIDTLLQGLAASGDRPELLDLLARLAAATGNSEPAFKITWAAAEKSGADPAKWCLAASASLAAGHRDSALAACARARSHVPNHPWACRIQTCVLLDSGKTTEALELLRSFGEPALRSDPRLVRLYARALAESGETGPPTSSRLNWRKLSLAGSPRYSVAYIRGLLDAKPDSGSARRAVGHANRLRSNWPDDPGVSRVLADALLRQSELASPPWNADSARAALRAYDWLPSSHQHDPEVVAAVAALQLNALQDPAAAARTVAPLLDPVNAALLTPVQREVLGAVFVATGKPDEAIAVLERATRYPGATAGCWVQLALAYHAKVRLAVARAALDRAREIPVPETLEKK